MMDIPRPSEEPMGTIAARSRSRAMRLFRDPLVLLLVATATAIAFFAVLVSL
jgi:hypothetical protein